MHQIGETIIIRTLLKRDYRVGRQISRGWLEKTRKKRGERERERER